MLSGFRHQLLAQSGCLLGRRWGAVGQDFYFGLPPEIRIAARLKTRNRRKVSVLAVLDLLPLNNGLVLGGVALVVGLKVGLLLGRFDSLSNRPNSLSKDRLGKVLGDVPDDFSQSVSTFPTPPVCRAPAIAPA